MSSIVIETKGWLLGDLGPSSVSVTICVTVEK